MGFVFQPEKVHTFIQGGVKKLKNWLNQENWKK